MKQLLVLALAFFLAAPLVLQPQENADREAGEQAALDFALAFLLNAPALSKPQENTEREAVRQAVLDYVEGIYNVEPARIERSVHPDLAKLGFSRRQTETAYRPDEKMTFAQLVEVAKTYNKAGRLPKDAPKEIVIYEVLDQTAAVKLTAIWGIDYMHLAKFDGQWKIINVLWQSPSKKATP